MITHKTFLTRSLLYWLFKQLQQLFEISKSLWKQLRRRDRFIEKNVKHVFPYCFLTQKFCGIEKMWKNFIQLIRGWLNDGRPASYNYSHPAMTVHCNRVHLQPPSPPNPPTPTPTPPTPTLSPYPTPPCTFISFSSSYSFSSPSFS